ncbi:NAD(P)/FAD-dependent oxidoreductase [Rhizobium alvei]|uniref:FAD-dependent oxidoreductase n=1 Tax=Rhizobium alvei TaxID=1132659 RepID=A0ABT8YFS4_9HYPH|nr:FAD-dependent oxidoreductase [Rhizobium alvei]MDO6962519.1 FAD-dependent oxidoreductase [Rhizobium alvei]
MNDPAFRTPIWTEGLTRRFVPQPVKIPASVDLAIVGGGFLGLSAALSAARRGLSVALFEAGRIGEGASGLNGGQVIPGIKQDPEWILANLGENAGGRLLSFAASTADRVFDLIGAEGMAVPHRRNGWIQACHTEKALAMATERHRQWANAGADVAMLGEAAISRKIGTDNYLGGFWDRRAGVINPLAFQHGLAIAAANAGAILCERTRCMGLRRRDGRWHLSLDQDRTVSAAKVIVAANAYSDGLIPGLKQSLVALHSFQIATAPLPETLERAILPEEQAVSDSRRILVYYRKTADNRLVLGGRGRMSLPRSPSDWAHLERALRRLFPATQGLPIERRWFGRVAMTPDHLPHIHEPEPGLITLVGCQGRGVALMTAAAPHLVDYLQGGGPDMLPFPVTPIAPIAFHRFRRIGVTALVTWYRALDALER